MILGFDFENCVETGEPVCFSWSDGTRKSIMHCRDPRASHVLGQILQHTLVGHNISYDMWLLKTWWPEHKQAVFRAYDTDRIHDTGLRDKLYLIAIRSPLLAAFESSDDGDEDSSGGRVMYSLADLYLRYFGEKLAKGADTWRMRYGELLDVPLDQWPEEARSYSEDDALAVRQVYEYQDHKHRHKIRCESDLVRTHFALDIVRKHGLYTDPDRVNAFEEKLRKKRDELLPKLLEHGFVSRHKKTGVLKKEVKFTQQYVLEHEPPENIVWTKPAKDRKSTKPFVPQVSLSKNSVKLYANPALVLFSDYSSVSTQLGDGHTKGKIAELRAQGKHFIVCSYDPIKLTARTGSAKPNVQNFSRKSGIRQCIIAPEGQVIVGGDYGNLELHALGEWLLYTFGESALARALQAGLDAHCLMAADISAADPDLPTYTYEELRAGIAADDKVAKNLRQLAKIPNFGCPGGMSAKALREYALGYGVTLTLEKAQELLNLWHKRWPEMRRYFLYIDKLVKSGLPVEGLYGGIFKGRPRFTDACNFSFQNLGARAATRGLWLVVRASEIEEDSPLYGTQPCIFVHDEIHVRCAVHRCDPVARELARLMQVGAAEYLPNVTPPVDPYAMFEWNKDAHTVYNDNGEIIPWRAEAA